MTTECDIISSSDDNPEDVLPVPIQIFLWKQIR